MPTQILVIEDENQIRENIADLLSIKGFEVQTASNGREGISQALLSPPDLILCDIRMPEVDGYQVLEVIRGTHSLATVPFIFLTAKTDGLEIRQGMVLGADDYLTKPFTMNNLLLAIDSRLKREAVRKADLQAKLRDHRHTIGQLSSHEHNTPLSGIIGFSSLLLDNYEEFDSEEVIALLSMIKASGLRLKRSLDKQRLIEVLQLVNSSHPSYPSFSTGTTQIDIELVEKQMLAIKEWQNCEVTGHLEIEPATLSISSENLTIILTELLDNALKFSDGSTPIRLTGHRENGVYQLLITNQGQPFKPEDVDRIAPYVQFERQHYEQQGFGLGLAIVKNLLAFNQGVLKIGSSSHKETTVSVTIPLNLLSDNVTQ
ncbi:hybrid sensor histidine kinase/response regulator [Spirosoma flavum]|uniref:histidine kinase n=1 Tax=Spirosoma flavum TaxID=2048557 RepID=A0ABW6AEJ2_9BACT